MVTESLTITSRPDDVAVDAATAQGAPTAGPIRAVACCAPLAREPISAEDAVGLAGVLKAIADPARLPQIPPGMPIG